MHPDIESERHLPSFNTEELTNILDGGAQNTALRRKVGKSRLGNGALAVHPHAFLEGESLHSSPTFKWASQVARVVKNPPASVGDVGDTGSIPG